MEKKSEILENFKTAIGSTVKSLSNLENVEVSFGNQNLNSEKAKVKLPEIELIDNKINYNQIRAIADSKSLNIRYSDLDTLKSFEPEGNISKKLYNLAEKIRCEKLGSDQFKGIKNNISKYYNEKVSSLDLKNSEDKITASFENYLREKFFNIKSSKEVEKKLKTYKKDLDNKFKNKIRELETNTLNQSKYNSLISELISKMSLDDVIEEDEKKRKIIEMSNIKIRKMKSKNLMNKKMKIKKCLLSLAFQI